MYKTTHLEEWIIDTYKWLNISQPVDIQPSRLCKEFDIYLMYKELPSNSFEQVRFKSITLDSRIPIQQQREEFFHELCHLLRHSGRQYMIPKAFLELQEAQANIFALYATLPYFMLKRYDLNDQDIVYILSETFTVTESLVMRRLEQIKNRILVNMQAEELKENESRFIRSC